MKVAMAPKRGVTSPDRGLLNSSMVIDLNIRLERLLSWLA
jgi:hypothetical protein